MPERSDTPSRDRSDFAKRDEDAASASLVAPRTLLAKDGLRPESWYRELFDRHPQPMYVCDTETLQFLAVNEAAIARYGYSHAEFLALTLADIRPPEDVAPLLRDLENLDDGIRGAGFWRHRLRDGRIITVEISSHLLTFEGRDAMIVLALDVTERMAAESALRDSLREQERLADELAEERARLIAAQSVAKIGSWQVDLATHRAIWSAEVYRIYDRERPAAGLTFEQAVDWIHPDDRERAHRAFADALGSRGALAMLEHRLVTPSGEIKHVEQRWRAESDALGTPVQVTGTCRDVTEQRQVLDALAVSEERFRIVASATNEGIYDMDIPSGRLWWNDGIETLFGFAVGTLPRSLDSWKSRIHPEDQDRVITSLGAARDGSAVDWSEEYRLSRFDGSYAYVQDRCRIMRNASGAASRIIGGLTDLSARREAETRLKEQSALLDAAHDAILVRDLDDRIVYWNKGAERIFGWSAAEAIGRTEMELFDLEPALYQAAREAVLSQGQWEGEMVKHTRTGLARHVEVRWTLVRNDAGAPRAVLGITLDVTERKQLEAQFLRAQRLESIGTLAGGIAHDLNNVLAPIMMSIELLRVGERDADRLETLATIEGSATRGADMVRQVLSFARGVEGQRATINPSILARDVVKIARETFPKDISVRLRMAQDLWSIEADPTQIHQVLMNLVVNARDAMSNGGTLEITMANAVLDETYASMHPGSHAGAYVSITVADSGTGIPPGSLDRIFEPFYTTKEHGKGTGLGLSTVHTLITSHGGFINVFSEPGKGARFVVHLPAVHDASMAHEIEFTELQLPRGGGEEILVVDDEESIRTIVQKTLERFGYRVHLASNGAEAVARYVQSRGRIDAVLTDMAMPVMDGPAMIIALRAIDPTARIIGSSGLVSSESLAQVIGAGVTHFVPKPYTAEALLTTLHRILHESA